MPNIVTENFDGVVVPAAPAGWRISASGMASNSSDGIFRSSPISMRANLAGASASELQYQTAKDGNNGDCEVSAEIYYTGLTALFAPLALRCAANTNFNTCYQLGPRTSTTGLTGLVIQKRVSSTNTDLGNAGDPSNFSVGTWYKLIARAVGTVIGLACQRVSDSAWLDLGGNWVADQGETVWGVVVTDSAISGEGYCGWRAAVGGQATYLDNFSFDTASVAPTNRLNPTWPKHNQLIQREANGTATVRLNGTYTGDITPTAIEASLDGVTYQTVDAAPAGGVWSGSLAGVETGYYTLRIRFANDTSVQVSMKIEVGDVIPPWGQSNQSGRVINNQSVYGSIALNSTEVMRAVMYGNDYFWKPLVDPYDTSVGQVDTVSSDTALGSIWPIVASYIMMTTGVPVAIVPCAKGGTSIDDGSTVTSWKIPADHVDRASLYGSANYRSQKTTREGPNAITGRKVLVVPWLQGEADAQSGMTKAQYFAKIQTLSETVFADLGCHIMPCKLPTLDTATVSQAAQDEINDAIQQAWDELPYVDPGADLTIIPTMPEDTLHIETDAKAAFAGKLIFDAIVAAGYYSGNGGGIFAQPDMSGGML